MHQKVRGEIALAHMASCCDRGHEKLFRSRHDAEAAKLLKQLTQRLTRRVGNKPHRDAVGSKTTYRVQRSRDRLVPNEHHTTEIEQDSRNHRAFQNLRRNHYDDCRCRTQPHHCRGSCSSHLNFVRFVTPETRDFPDLRC
jgi:hypothetical protein